MNRLIVLLIILTFGYELYAQSQEVSFYGYINFSGIYDSRQSVAARDGHFLLYPKPKALDVTGGDVNANPSMQFAVIQTRIGAKFTGTKFFGAKATGVLEAEFMGNSESDNNGLRIRHAYVNLEWERDALLIGQTWGMLTPPEMIPGVVASNGASPINAFGRHPQIRYSHTFSAFKFITALQSQRDYTSTGPNGAAAEYIKNAIMPELHAHLQYKSEGLFAGFGGSYKTLRPMLKTALNYAADETVEGYAAIGYLKAEINGLTIRTEGLYGANLHELTMTSGYAVTGVNPVTQEESYSPLRISSYWIDFAYGKEIEVGLFAGFSKNLGSDLSLTGKYYARGQDVDKVVRIAPRVQVGDGKVKFCFEIEHTIASYGKNDLYGKVTDTYNVGNTRGLLSVFYFL